jgi:hypothetical protein
VLTDGEFREARDKLREKGLRFAIILEPAPFDEGPTQQEKGAPLPARSQVSTSSSTFSNYSFYQMRDAFYRSLYFQKPRKLDPWEMEIPRKEALLYARTYFLDGGFEYYQTCPTRLKLLEDGTNFAAIDAQGVTLEFFTLIAKEILNLDYHWFHPTPSGTYYPTIGSTESESENFYFFGRFIGKCVYEKLCVPLPFALPVFKVLTSRPLTFEDLGYIDKELYETLCKFKTDPATQEAVESDELPFVFSNDKLVDIYQKEFPIVEGGHDVHITSSNYLDYVYKYAEKRVVRLVETQLRCLLAGFTSIIPRSVARLLTPECLNLILCGEEKVNINDMKEHTQVQGVPPEVCQWFWQAVQEMNNNQRVHLLQFITGLQRVPAGGFKQLPKPITLLGVGKHDQLPTASVCFFQLKLGTFSSYAHLKSKLNCAVEYGCVGFQFS